MTDAERDWLLDAAGLGTNWTGTYKGNVAQVLIRHRRGLIGGSWTVQVFLVFQQVWWNQWEWWSHKGGKAWTRARASFDEWVAYFKANP